MANSVVKPPSTMERLRDNQLLARLMYTLFLEQGITRTSQQLHLLGLQIRARHSGITAQATPGSLSFSYDHPSQPLSELKYSAAGSRYHCQLTPLAMRLPLSRQHNQAVDGPISRAWGQCCAMLQSDAFLRSTKLIRASSTWRG